MLANSPPMSTGDTTAVASVLVDIGIGLIAFRAFVVSCLAWRESRRSADASEESARTAARSAVAEEAAVALARREAEQREADRRDAAGPQFRPAETYTYHKGYWQAEVHLRIDGGPDVMSLHIELVPDTSFVGLPYRSTDEPQDSLTCDLSPGAVFELYAQHASSYGPNDLARVLMLLITATPALTSGNGGCA